MIATALAAALIVVIFALVVTVELIRRLIQQDQDLRAELEEARATARDASERATNAEGRLDTLTGLYAELSRHARHRGIYDKNREAARRAAFDY